MWGPLSIKNFRLFILGHFLSFTGSWIQTTALHWLIYNFRQSTSDLGFFVFLTTFPTIFITFFSGFLIDRFNKKRFLKLLLSLSILPPFFMGILIHWGYFNFWIFSLLSFFSTVLASIDMPLRQVFISEIVPPIYLTKALSLQALSFNLARILGPAIAGYLMYKFPLMLCFFLNALSFLPLLIFLKFIKPIIKKEKSLEKIHLITEVKNFFQFLKKDKKIILILIILANFTFFATSIIILLPMFVDKVLHSSAKDFAYLSSGIGIGAILGALSVYLFKELRRKVYYLYIAHLFWILGMLCFILGKSFKLFYLGVLLVGFSFTNFFPVVNAYLQERTPLEFRGKVMSLFSIAFLSMAPLGQSIMGFLAGFLPYKILLLIMITSLALLNSIFLLKFLSPPFNFFKSIRIKSKRIKKI